MFNESDVENAIEVIKTLLKKDVNFLKKNYVHLAIRVSDKKQADRLVSLGLLNPHYKYDKKDVYSKTELGDLIGQILNRELPDYMSWAYSDVGMEKQQKNGG